MTSRSAVTWRPLLLFPRSPPAAPTYPCPTNTFQLTSYNKATTTTPRLVPAELSPQSTPRHPSPPGPRCHHSPQVRTAPSVPPCAAPGPAQSGTPWGPTARTPHPLSHTPARSALSSAVPGAVPPSSPGLAVPQGWLRSHEPNVPAQHFPHSVRVLCRGSSFREIPSAKVSSSLSLRHDPSALVGTLPDISSLRCPSYSTRFRTVYAQNAGGSAPWAAQTLPSTAMESVPLEHGLSGPVVSSTLLDEACWELQRGAAWEVKFSARPQPPQACRGWVDGWEAAAATERCWHTVGAESLGGTLPLHTPGQCGQGARRDS